MTNKELERFEKARKMARELYEQALDMPHIRKPLSWALYCTWKKFDAKEKPRKGVIKNEQIY